MLEKQPIAIITSSEQLDEFKMTLSQDAKLVVCFASPRAEEVLAYHRKQAPHWNEMIVLLDMTVTGADASFLSAVKRAGIPLIAIASSVKEGFAAIEQGASDMVVRRSGETGNSAFFYKMVAMQILKTAEEYRKSHRRSGAPQEGVKGRIVAIGSSTGGTPTLLQILKDLPADAPPVLVVQHMPPVFTKLYADRADTVCAMHAAEARDGDYVTNGQVLIAPGDYHMTLEKEHDRYRVRCKKGEKVHGQCPAVDVLFNSIAAVTGEAVGVILTGMGADGAEGLLKMRKKGAYTIGQDEATSIVYGMPRAAYELGAVIAQLPLEKIAQEILEHARR